MVKKENQFADFSIPLCYLLEQLKIKLVYVFEIHPAKLTDWNSVETYQKKNILTRAKLLAVKTEKWEALAADKKKANKVKQARAPDKETNRKLFLSSDFDSENDREKISLTQVFNASKKVAKSKQKADKPKLKKIKLIK